MRKFALDSERAKQLLERAGFPKGEGFPKIHLLINRNDTQQRVARLVARMWKQNLNLDTEIDVKEPAELEAFRAAGQFDLIRRGIDSSQRATKW
jgi:oligopeptide transport system substrate-binding protein